MRFLYILLILLPALSFGQYASFSTSYRSNAAFSSTAQEVFARMATEPPMRYKIAMARFIDRQVRNGNWPLILDFQCRALDTEANSLKGWKGVFNGTNNGATHTPGYGFVYDGVNDYVDTGFNPSTMGGNIYTQNEGGVGWFIKKTNNNSGTANLGGVFQNTTNRLSIAQVPGSTGLTFRVNQQNATTYSSELYLYGGTLYTFFRSNSTTINISMNERPVLSTATVSTTTPPNGLVYEGALNNAGPTGYLAVELGCFFAYKSTGFNQTKFYNDLVWMLREIEGGYPAWCQAVVEIVGQSNAVGTTNGDTPSFSAIQTGIPNVYMHGTFTGTTFPQLDFSASNNKGDLYGAELTCGLALQQQFSKDVYMDKVAYGGAPISAESGRTDFNVSTLEAIVDLKNSLVQMGVKCHTLEKAPLIFVIWVQGERDAGNGQYASWKQNYTDIQNYLTSNFCAMHKVLITQINTGLIATGLDATGVNTVRDQQRLMTETDDIYTLFDMNRYTLDSRPANNVHYTGVTYEQQGYDYEDWVTFNLQ